MIEHLPDSRVSHLEQLLEMLTGASEVILTTHINADGDGVGSQIALASFLRDRGVPAWIVNPTTFPENYRFLLPDPSWVLPVKSARAARRCRQANLAVVVDTSEKNRIGHVHELIQNVPKVVIDHHPTGDDTIDAHTFRDVTASATGEIIFDLLAHTEDPWSKEVVRALYIAIFTDTGGFRFANTTARCLLAAARLVELGARPEVLQRAVYPRLPLRHYKLLQATLATLSLDNRGQVAWMCVPQEAFCHLGATPEDLEGFVDIPRNIDGVQVGLLFRSTSDGRTKVSFRSVEKVDVNLMARHWQGGGHRRAAGAVVNGKVKDVVPEVVRQVCQSLQELPLDNLSRYPDDSSPPENT